MAESKHHMRKKSEGRKGRPVQDQAAAGKYICDMVLELKNVSHRADLAFLTRILEMAYEEAYMVANRIEPPKAELEELARVLERAKEWEKEKKRSA
jgi:hypothetical protein